MIYFDNAATGGFKPQAAVSAAVNVIKYLSANPGRSGHRLSVTGAKIVESAREIFSEKFNDSHRRFIFGRVLFVFFHLAHFPKIRPCLFAAFMR